MDLMDPGHPMWIADDVDPTWLDSAALNVWEYSGMVLLLAGDKARCCCDEYATPLRPAVHQRPYAEWVYEHGQGREDGCAVSTFIADELVAHTVGVEIGWSRQDDPPPPWVMRHIIHRAVGGITVHLGCHGNDPWATVHIRWSECRALCGGGSTWTTLRGAF